MRVSIGVKLALLSVLVVGVATAVAFFYATERERQRVIEAKRSAASMVADLLAQSLQAPLDFDDEEAARSELGHLRQNKEVVYAGVWQVGTPTPMVELGATGLAFPVPTDLETPRTLALPDRVETLRTVIGRSQKPIGTALIQFSLARENAELVIARRHILLYCLGLALGTLCLLILATRYQIVRPIQHLLDAARRIERGESQPVKAHANDEIGRLAAAFNAMNAAIFDRERRLSAANASLRELFDHMRQGIVVFGSDAKVEGTSSKAAAQIFGKAELEGCDARDLLYGAVGAWDAERRAFEEWLPLGFELPPEAWAEVSSLAPPRIRLSAGGDDDRDVLLEFRPIVHDGKVAKIMLLATDETDQRRLEREMERQGARHKSQIAVMRRLVSGGAQQFVAFLDQARRRLESASVLTEQAIEGLSPSSLAQVFQIVHTLRAEALSFELRELSDVLRDLEAHLVELREPSDEAPALEWHIRKGELDRALAAARALIDQSEELFVQASPLGRAALDNVWVRKSDVTRLVQLCSGRKDEIARNVARLAARPFGECVTGVIEQASTWAAKEDKRVSVDVDGREELVPPALADVLGGVLAHLVRNAIAHGIEPVAERTSLGKAPVGSIELVCRSTDAESAILFVADDGRGVSGNSLLADAARTARPLQGLTGTSRSTRRHSGELAGCGVGLSAVEADLARVGYALAVAPRGGGGTRFEIRPRAEQPS